jgi:hypothetical protein
MGRDLGGIGQVRFSLGGIGQVKFSAQGDDGLAVEVTNAQIHGKHELSP